MKELIPANDLELLAEGVRETASKLKLSGLSPKQKKFVLTYAGDRYAAAKAAGYSDRGSTEWAGLVVRLMHNPQIRYNITLIDQLLARYCVMSAVEIKMKLSERLRSDSLSDANRAVFSKLMLQTHGELSEKLLIESKSRVEHKHTVSISHFAAEPTERELAHNESMRLEVQQQLQEQASKLGMVLIPEDSVISPDENTSEPENTDDIVL